MADRPGRGTTQAEWWLADYRRVLDQLASARTLIEQLTIQRETARALAVALESELALYDTPGLADIVASAQATVQAWDEHGAAAPYVVIGQRLAPAVRGHRDSQ